uniref:Secreted protein n=1 Tax=Anguilla anguilla TaxID=7936 RepID=A0A0E9QS59_ANGAN
MFANFRNTHLSSVYVTLRILLLLCVFADGCPNWLLSISVHLYFETVYNCLQIKAVISHYRFWHYELSTPPVVEFDVVCL